jgi:aspartate 1-decarboxylase
MVKRGRELIQLNSATAHLGRVGDRLTIMSFARYRPEEAVGHLPRVAVLNDKMKFSGTKAIAIPLLRLSPRKL